MMNEETLRALLHRGGGEATDYGREIVRLGSYGDLMNADTLTEVGKKLDDFAAHIFLIKCDVERAIQDLGKEEQP